ncbi:MAG: hypothetical protein ACKOE7_00385, partial [Actinomycetota bacterium]
TFELVDVVEQRDARGQSVRALVSVDGGRAYAPSITKFTRIGMNVGTPSVRTTLTHDIYLTLEPPVRQDSGQARITLFDHIDEFERMARKTRDSADHQVDLLTAGERVRRRKRNADENHAEMHDHAAVGPPDEPAQS